MDIPYISGKGKAFWLVEFLLNHPVKPHRQHPLPSIMYCAVMMAGMALSIRCNQMTFRARG